MEQPSSGFEQRKPDPIVIEEYSRRLKSQVRIACVLVPVIIAFSFMKSGQMDGFQIAAAWMMIFVVVGCVWLSYRNFRCPACNCYLGRNFWHSFCARRGVQLKAEKGS